MGWQWLHYYHHWCLIWMTRFSLLPSYFNPTQTTFFKRDRIGVSSYFKNIFYFRVLHLIHQLLLQLNEGFVWKLEILLDSPNHVLWNLRLGFASWPWWLVVRSEVDWPSGNSDKYQKDRRQNGPVKLILIPFVWKWVCSSENTRM